MTAAGYALVTGASSGIGECFARALSERRQNLILVARSADKLAALATQLRRSSGIETLPFPCDLSTPGAASELAQSLRERKLDVNLLINNAGFGARGEFWTLPLDRQSEMVRLHLGALVELTHHLLPPMAGRRSGAVINVSSITGFEPVPYAAIYAATKAFMTSFSMAVAEELRPYGVRVVTLCPGGTRTNLVIEGIRHGRGRFPGGAQAPEEVVEAALARFDHGGGLMVPRLVNKASVFAQRLVPRALVPWAVAKMSRPEGL